MIERIVIENFKSLRKVDLKLGRLNLFIGSNASGKSNFFDALRVLQGIGNGFTISEILDGKPRSATSEVWEGIRGGSAMACFAGEGDDGQVRIQAKGSLPGKARTGWNYSVAFSPALGKVTSEFLFAAGSKIYDSEEVAKNSPTDPVFEVKYYSGRVGRQPHLKLERARPALTQLARGNGAGSVKKADVEACSDVARLLADMQRLDPSPAVLREYSKAHRIVRMGERGENFAALVATIAAEPSAKDAYLSWLRQLRPAEVDDVLTLKGAVGEPLFALREGAREYAAPVLSDGTLRFAAITAAFFQPAMPSILTLEEIENGIHASRVRLLVELLRSRTAGSGTQVMATTHSPIVLAWLNEAEYGTTFFCKRDEATGESIVRALPKVPHFDEVMQQQPIGDLFAEGWLESAL
jgi:predicted ATPase